VIPTCAELQGECYHFLPDTMTAKTKQSADAISRRADMALTACRNTSPLRSCQVNPPTEHNAHTLLYVATRGDSVGRLLFSFSLWLRADLNRQARWLPGENVTPPPAGVCNTTPRASFVQADPHRHIRTWSNIRKNWELSLFTSVIATLKVLSGGL